MKSKNILNMIDFKQEKCLGVIHLSVLIQDIPEEGLRN